MKFLASLVWIIGLKICFTCFIYLAINVAYNSSLVMFWWMRGLTFVFAVTNVVDTDSSVCFTLLYIYIYICMYSLAHHKIQQTVNFRPHTLSNTIYQQKSLQSFWSLQSISEISTSSNQPFSHSNLYPHSKVSETSFSMVRLPLK